MADFCEMSNEPSSSIKNNGISSTAELFLSSERRNCALELIYFLLIEFSVIVSSNPVTQRAVARRADCQVLEIRRSHFPL
jgi:hypothetical protein